MKKWCMAIVLASILLTACGSKSKPVSPAEPNVQVIDNRQATAEKTDLAPVVVDNRQKENVDAAVTVTVADEEFEKTGYIFENIIGDSLYFYIVKNNSDAAVKIGGNATAYDSAGNTIGASQRSIDVLGPGETSLLVFYFDSVTGIDKIDCALSYDTSTYYKPVINNIRMEQTINDKNLTVIATNEGNINAQFVEAYALFFDADNNVVSYSSQYITDGDSEIKPGATLSAQLDSYAEFDHVECYLTGRSDGKASAVTNEVSDSDFAIKEYKYENTIGDSLHYLIVKNNSSKTVGINGNMTAYDASGSVIGAADGRIDVLGPGEESIATFFFDSVKGIDHTDYTLSYDTSPYFESGIKDVDIVQNINANNIVVTVTNNGTEATKFLEAYALFLDAEGNVVSTDSAYLVDNDSEVKPGASISKQLNSYKDFDTVEVYFTGRRGGL